MSFPVQRVLVALFLFALSPSLGCKSESNEIMSPVASGRDLTENDERAILGIALVRGALGHKPVVADKTMPESLTARRIVVADVVDALAAKGALRRIDKGLVGKLVANVNGLMKTPRSIPRSVLGGGQSGLMDVDEIISALRGCTNGEDASLACGWNKISMRFPESDSVVLLSRVGSVGKHALVYLELYCERACGKGRLFFLENQEGSWQMVESVGIWDR